MAWGSENIFWTPPDIRSAIWIPYRDYEMSKNVEPIFLTYRVWHEWKHKLIILQELEKITYGDESNSKYS